MTALGGTVSGQLGGGKGARSLLVLGARQYAPVFADVFDGVDGYSIVAFVENLDRNFCSAPIFGRPVRWIDDIAPLASDADAICCLATVKRDGFVGQAAALGFAFATLVHPTAWVSPRSTLGPGTSLDVGVIVAAFTMIGAHVRVGRGATIGHHTTIAPFSTLHPRANIAGNCTIEEKVTIGMGANVVDGRRIGRGSFVAAGAVVTTDLPPGVLAGGVPAKILRENYDAV